MPTVNAVVAASEIERVSRSRIIFVAWGTQQAVVSTAPMVPAASTKGKAIGFVSDASDLLGFIAGIRRAGRDRPVPAPRSRHLLRECDKRTFLVFHEDFSPCC